MDVAQNLKWDCLIWNHTVGAFETPALLSPKTSTTPHWTAQTCALSVSASLCVYRTKITEEQKIRRKRKPSTQLRVGTVQSICSARGRPWAPFLPRENQQRWGVQLKVWGSSSSPRYPGHQSPLVNCSETSAVSGVVGGCLHRCHILAWYQQQHLLFAAVLDFSWKNKQCEDVRSY